jgi:pimeloyl-ACP methyl ester carboxylesterase
MRRLLLALLVLLVLGVGGLVASSLLSLDWSRQHRARTARLPLLSQSRADGLVRIEAQGLEFRARVRGLEGSGPALILLHGFPETSAMWVPLIEAAAAAGFRVVAFDQRGTSPGARPGPVEAYTVEHTMGDLLAVADAVGFGRFHLVGHDWGAVVGWLAVASHPERIRTWTALSIPHPGPLIAELRKHPPAYIRVFQTPWIPELLFSFAGFRMLRAGYDHHPPELREEYEAVFSEPGALSAALDWYRAIPQSLAAAGDGPFEVERPTLFLWGSREGWVRGDRLAKQRALVRAPYQEIELDAGHWLMQEATGRVVEAVLAHLGRS